MSRFAGMPPEGLPPGAEVLWDGLGGPRYLLRDRFGNVFEAGPPSVPARYAGSSCLGCHANLDVRDTCGDQCPVRRWKLDLAYGGGDAPAPGKTSRSLRTVPLPARAAEALAAHPARIDTPLLFPAPRGGHIELHAWRAREWYPALRAAGIEPRVPYALRHTYASVSIAAGVSMFELSRFMGTSPAMLDKTYGHLLPDALERTRGALDGFLAAGSAERLGAK